MLGLEEIGKALIKDWEVDPQPQAVGDLATALRLDLDGTRRLAIDIEEVDSVVEAKDALLGAGGDRRRIKRRSGP